MTTILLLNLPYARPVQRDYGCPHGIKAAYNWPPIDLLLFGAMVRRSSHLLYIDGIADRRSTERLLEDICRAKPDAVFTILSSITRESDFALLREIRRRLPKIKIWASGDVIFFSDERFPEVDFYVRDLTNMRVVNELLLNNSETGDVPPDPSEQFSLGICPHDIVRDYHYSMPYSLHCGITSVLTNYGCPFACSFCNSNKIPFKRRAVDEVLEELRFIRRLGIREVFIRDFTFTLSHVDQIAGAMIRERLSLRWSCFSSATLVDRQMLRTMKAAGCYLICYGAESGDSKILERTRKAATIPEIKKAVRMTKDEGIEVLTSFIIGFPGEDRQKTVNFIFDADPDYLSLNILVPRLGSQMRDETAGYNTDANTDSLISDDSELYVFRNDVERSFYLRPRKLIRYLQLSLKTPYRLAILMNNAIALFKRWFLTGGMAATILSIGTRL